jgi:hypothetical protein
MDPDGALPEAISIMEGGETFNNACSVAKSFH